MEIIVDPTTQPHFTLHRYLSVFAGVLVQICLGGIYAFSAYVPELTGSWGFTAVETQTIFGATIGLFTVIMIFTGRLLRRVGPRPLILISGTLFIIGHIAAAYSADHHWLLFAGFLLCLSPALSFGYVCPVSSGLLWFPNHRGLITGIAVAGYGAGGVILTTFVEYLFAAGMDLQQVMITVAFTWGGTILLCGLISFNPPGLVTRLRTRSVRLASHGREFSALTVFLFFGTLPGLMLIGIIKPFGLEHGLTIVEAAAGIAALSIGNGAGRITWGIVADRLPPRLTTVLNMTGVFSSVLIFGFFTHLFIPAAFLLGFCFGGPLVIAPDQTARVFGPTELSSVYPFATVFHGMAAAFGAPLSGFIFQQTGTYDVAVLLAAGGTVLGTIVYLWLTNRSAPLHTHHARYQESIAPHN